MSEDKGLIPYQEVEKMGVAIAKSGLFGIKTSEQAIALMLVAQAQNRHPATVAMEYDIIQGRPALKSQAALMRFQEAGGKIRYTTRTDVEVSADFSHPAGGTVTVTWDMKRAAKMGLADKDNWKKQPMIMLQWRVVAEGVRACFPACLGGSYLVEEVQDFEPIKPSPRDITPPEAQPPKPPVTQPQEKAAGVDSVITGVDNVTIFNFKKKDGSQGTKYIIHAGEKYETFSETTATEAKRAKEAGLMVTITYKTDAYGRKIESLTVNEPSAPREPGQEG